MKKIGIVAVLLIFLTSTSPGYASGLTDPVVESPVKSEQETNSGGGFKKFLLLLLLVGI